jgi:murein DD-endopeptidase MepM/ murein hydrolase activator NlpD
MINRCDTGSEHPDNERFMRDCEEWFGKKVSKITLNGQNMGTSIRNDTTLLLSHDTVLQLNVWVKNRNKPYTRYQKIKVRNLTVNGFLVYRDRFNPNKIKIVWDVSGAKRVNISRLGTQLGSAGRDSIYSTQPMQFELTAMNEFDTIYEIRYVPSSANKRPLIIGDKPLEVVNAEDKIKMAITEIDMNLYPELISLKVLAFDSLGHFVTNMAPPYADEKVARKFFKRITQRIGNFTTDLEFSVREFHEGPRVYDLSLVLDYSGSMTTNINFLEEATERLLTNHDLMESTPSILPTAGLLSSGFSHARLHPISNEELPHIGLDFSAVTGTPILAAAKGVVSYAGWKSGYGNTVEVDHGFGIMTRYAHSDRNLVEPGQAVARGEILAQVGSTGRATASHLHYEIWKDGVAENPRDYILNGVIP